MYKRQSEDRALLEETSAAFDVVGGLIERHHQKNALNEAMRVVGDINKYISATEPWKIKDDEKHLATVLHVAAQAVADANHLLAPFLPHSAQKVWEGLGGKGTFSPLPHIEEVEDLDNPDFHYPVITGDYKLGVNVHPWKSEAIDTGVPVAKPKPIFAKIPQEAVQEELDRFEEQLAQRWPRRRRSWLRKRSLTSRPRRPNNRRLNNRGLRESRKSCEYAKRRDLPCEVGPVAWLFLWLGCFYCGALPAAPRIGLPYPLEATSRSVASMSASISTDRSTICGAVTASPRLMLA